ncbi:hypothetical protein MBLNU459_g2310t1 [Dothideomycetes sp. NU459]
MAESGHKRSKSAAIAKSLLHRVTSKQDVPSAGEADDQSPVTPVDGAGDSPSSLHTPSALTPSSSQPSFHQSTPSRPHLATTMTNSTLSADQQASPARPVGSPSSPIGPATSIEQSVRLFKVFEALRTGDTAAISTAIRESDARRLEGTTILHIAVQCAEPSVVEFVLSLAGTTLAMDINARDRDGNTALHVASQLGRVSVVKLLLDQDGINESIANFHGKTALDLARNPDTHQHLQLARSIFLDTTVRKIRTLVQTGDYDALEALLADSHTRSVVDVNGSELATDPATVESGGTLLHEAARKKDVRLAQMLLLNGADPFRRDHRGKLPPDVTKDDRTKVILKKSPAAAAAQRGVQEKAILGANGTQIQGASAENALSVKEAREMKGYLKKWTNYTSGWKLRWFVLEDGVLSYYKHQDDAGSACRGAINMRIAKLHMDPKEKLTFEIHGKSSVKYHLKANHEVEAKRWFWSLNNAIQWSKDEARDEVNRQRHETETLRQVRNEQLDKRHSQNLDTPGATFVPSNASGASLHPRGSTSIVGDADFSTYGSSFGGDTNVQLDDMQTDMDEDGDFGDDESVHSLQPANKDAFNITAQSAKLQLDLLAQVSAALQREKTQNPSTPISDQSVDNALVSYDTAVSNLRGLLMDMLRISRDHESYWQARLDRETNVRRLWEESMARVAREQEELETRIGQSEEKRKRTKRALREALEGQGSGAASHNHSRKGTQTINTNKIPEAVAGIAIADDGTAADSPTLRRRTTLADLTNDAMSDDESDMEEEFFDAIDAGEVQVMDEMPTADAPPTPGIAVSSVTGAHSERSTSIEQSYKGYEGGVRTKLALDADNRPKISLWGILKNMIGKDMTKMTLPVSFNEPTSLLYRVVEDMQYSELLDTAADRADSTERMVYVAAFAASEYASTIGRVAKPFNPLLGETYEYVRPDKGYRFFIEQVSHHPPIGAAFAESAKWDYFGESSVKSKFYGKSFDINPLGTWFLRLRPTHGGPEELYTWKKVTSSVVGIITGNPTVDNYGIMEVKNWTTGESCTLDFKQRGWKASSAYQVAGRVCDRDGVPKWSMGGRWNDKIYARLTPGYESDVTKGDKGENQAFLVWEAAVRPPGIPFNLTPFVVTLNHLPDHLRKIIAPTDSRLRPDQRAMEDGEYDLAATEKTRVEEMQRSRRRERDSKGEEFVPMWFEHARDETTGEMYWKFKENRGGYWGVRDSVARGEGDWTGCEEIY